MKGQVRIRHLVEFRRWSGNFLCFLMLLTTNRLKPVECKVLCGSLNISIHASIRTLENVNSWWCQLEMLRHFKFHRRSWWCNTNRKSCDTLDYYHKCSWLDPRPGRRFQGLNFRLSLDTICEYGLKKRW